MRRLEAISLMRRFEAMSVLRQSTLIVFLALAGADLLTTIFYGIFFSDRYLLDIVLTSIIVIIVGYPLAYFFLSQNVRLRAMAVELDRAARIDDLTGLYNRRTFFSECEVAIKGLGEGAFLYVDVDHFKKLNDRFGHAAGDSVLREFGDVISVCVRGGDVAARLGGEEFGIYLAHADIANALKVAERIRKRSLQIGPAVGLDDVRVTVSIGIALRDQGQTLDELMQLADENLYAAKEQGRDRVVFGASGKRAA
ncbi:GGDEF domain-containing protein [Pseudaminobacter soli (ex Li et al. 2025)]|uniref:diguanylate cyclase n=1 Tax=Pseudaminobacter soli (ex Li et al. 2025) TaxID=1295366 RepID=A0A2P7SNG2_9HYPH|nr:GGDEF domain-containing protein [Mesorhizobium soli]PSJ64030.1 GGDEF domain-containing protein [Mesorhizobium soli]